VKNRYGIGFFAVCVCMITTVSGEDATDIALRVRAAVGEVMMSLPFRSGCAGKYVEEFGYKYKQTPGYYDLANVVSNNSYAVYSHFGLCATNDLARMVLLSSAWAYDEEYYLVSFSNVLELAVNGVLTKKEFLWFRLSSRDSRFLGLLPMQYDRPGISNLVLRMQSYTGETNYCQRILDGSAKTDAVEYMESFQRVP